MRSFSDRIKSIASDYADNRTVEDKSNERRAKEEQDFLSRFRLASERFIIPTLKLIEEHSNDRVQFSASGLTLTVSAQMTHNKIVFLGDYKRELVVVATNGRDQTSIELAQLNQEWVEKEVEARISTLLPRD